MNSALVDDTERSGDTGLRRVEQLEADTSMIERARFVVLGAGESGDVVDGDALDRVDPVDRGDLVVGPGGESALQEHGFDAGRQFTRDSDGGSFEGGELGGVDRLDDERIDRRTTVDSGHHEVGIVVPDEQRHVAERTAGGELCLVLGDERVVRCR